MITAIATTHLSATFREAFTKLSATPDRRALPRFATVVPRFGPRPQTGFARRNERELRAGKESIQQKQSEDDSSFCPIHESEISSRSSGTGRGVTAAGGHGTVVPMDIFAPRHLLIILLVVLLVFGTKKLKTIGSDIGGALRGFKQAMREGETDSNAAASTPPQQPSDAVPPQAIGSAEPSAKTRSEA